MPCNSLTSGPIAIPEKVHPPRRRASAQSQHRPASTTSRLRRRAAPERARQKTAGSAEEARGLEALEVLDGLDAELEGGVLVAGEGHLRVLLEHGHGEHVVDAVLEAPPVWKSTSELGRQGQTSERSRSVKSTSIRLIFGRIDCSRRVLEA